jgi:tRNA(Glu) U13 pseudouridine synthase TruD
MWRGEYIAAFRRYTANQKCSALLENPRFRIKRPKLARAKELNFQRNFPKSRRTKRGSHNVHTGALNANRFLVIFQGINYNVKPLDLMGLHGMESRYRKS